MNAIGKNQSILLVEDNEDDAFLMKRALASAGVKNPLHVVQNGQQALDYLEGKGDFANRAMHPYPSFVFLDLKLPYLSGIDILKWKQERRDLPPTVVIVVTSSDEPRDLAAAYQFGANSYIVKPPTTKLLEGVANAFRDYWLTFNRIPES